jgi:hypothetical protein
VSHAALPTGMLTVGQLLPRRPFTVMRIGRHWHTRERPPEWQPPLTPYPDAASLWAAVGRGEFPPPVRGPWGIAWAQDDVLRWRHRRGLA